VLLPELARLHSDGNYRQLLFLWHESIRKVALIVVGVVAFAEFFAEPFIVTLYSDAYLASVPYFRIFQIRLILRVTLFGYLLQSIGKTRMILYITIGAIIFKVPVSIGLYKLMGPYGPACSSIVVAASMTAYHMWYVARAVKAPVKRVWPWLVHIKIIAAGFAAAAVSAVTLFIPTAKISAILSGMWPWLSDKTSATSLMQLVIGGVVFAPLYVVFLALTGTIRKKDFELLKSMTVGRFMKKRDNGKAPEKPDE
jgi:O-antigen/teichoic acid export membrane protein